MLNSSKLFKALATAGLLTLGSVSAFAQAQSCTTFATNTILRPEGLTENIGKITIGNCTADLPDQFEIQVQLPTNFIITNGSNANQRPVLTALTGTINPADVTYSYPASIPNAINISVTNANGGAVTVRDLTIDGLRVNVNNAVVNGFPTGAGAGSQVNAYISVNSGSTMLSVTNPNPVVGQVSNKTLEFSVVGGNDATANSAAGTIYTCSPSASGSVFGFVRFKETFGGALKTQVGSSPTETGENGGVPTSATTGTRIRIAVSNLPAGVTALFPAGVITTGGNTLTYRSGLGTVDATVTPTYLLAPGDVLYAGGYAPATSDYVVYEVTTAAPFTTDTLNVPFAVKYTAGPAIGIGSADVRGGLAPQDSTAFPRFADVTDQGKLLSTAICSTTILFPYVTTDAGFDTGLAVSNTSADPRGTVAQAGACSVNVYGTLSSGATLPAAGSTPVVNAGRTYAFSLTDSPIFDGEALGSGFNGYVIAVCDFQLAHGYTFISTYGLSGSNAVAQGYLGLIIPNTGVRGFTTTTGAEELNN